MRIGIDARFYGGEQSKGLGRYTQKLIEHLAQFDHDNEYVVFLQQESFDRWNIIQKNIIPVLAPYRWYTIQEQIFMPLKIREAKVDLMHFPHFNVPLFYRGPFIVTIHDLIILRFPTERATTLGPLLYTIKHVAGKMVMNHAVKSARQIITVSEFSRSDIIDYYHVDPAKVRVTYEAAEVVAHPETLSDADQQQILQQYQITSPYLLYIGNAYPHKNIELLLEVLVQIKQQRGTVPWKLILVGKKDYFYTRLAEEAQKKGVSEEMVFTGFVPDQHLPVLYAHAQAYIFPSVYEGFGLPPLEAMSYGVPVLAASSSCLPEILGDAALYFHPSDVSGIIHAIDTILESQEVRDRLIHAGHEQVKRYSWQRMMQQTWEMYENQVKQIKKT